MQRTTYELSNQKVKTQTKLQIKSCQACLHYYLVKSNKIATTYRCDIDQSIIIHPQKMATHCQLFEE